LSLLQSAKLAQFIPMDIGAKFVELGLSPSNSYKFCVPLR
jgi:hypothetical protein